ncbi:MAG TPA: peptide ABC transporter ATP-binding protein [Firmicutes bacterium]|jgi:polar amino acid transport system ATP-binding protein|nr:peptide ABC transporter ATP-binding protein [Bacillota bacterium]HBG44575.1 peptide ABC transporter ATP-binding protein [Bacillota bacterium]HBL69175.1 peptide ABC transporter ATP-binding protein [Bacillota bacterium]HCT37679.1 peptide ABC transporter ATP-binding protein [Bacillota bacterium]
MLTVRNLKKAYGSRVALNGVDLEVHRGETVAIMGPSGCGKSTLVRCLNRLTEPDAGSILFAGREVTTMGANELLETRRRIGFVFQQSNLIKRLSVLDNVAMGQILNGMDRKEAEQLALGELARVGMADRAGDYPENLSGGQRQRVGIARALALKPEIMLWDEPTASLDPILVGEVIEVLENLAQIGTTMLVVTHELYFALRAAQRVILMDHGQVVEQGHPQAVFANPVSEVGRKYRDLLERWREPALTDGDPTYRPQRGAGRRVYQGEIIPGKVHIRTG